MTRRRTRATPPAPSSPPTRSPATKCPESNLIKIKPAGQSVEFCAGYNKGAKLAVTMTAFVQIEPQIHLTSWRPSTGGETANVATDGYMRWREQGWLLQAPVDINQLTSVPLSTTLSPLKDGRFNIFLAGPFSGEQLCARLRPFELSGGLCP